MFRTWTIFAAALAIGMAPSESGAEDSDAAVPGAANPGAPGPDAAEPPPPDRQVPGALDGAAAALARVEFSLLSRASEIAELAEPRAAAAIRAAAALFRARTGYDLTSAEDWQRAGLDPERAVWISLLAPKSGPSAYAGSPLVVPRAWRTRLLLPLAEPERAESSLREIAAALLELGPVRGEGGEDAGGDAGGPFVFAAENLASGIAIRGRRTERFFVIEAIAPAASPREGAGIGTPDQRADAAMPSAAQKALQSAEVGIWIDPGRAYGALHTLERLRRAAPLFSRRSPAADRGSEASRDPEPFAAGYALPSPPACRPFSRLARRGALGALALQLRERAGALAIRARYDLRDPGLGQRLGAAPPPELPPARAELALAWSLESPAALAALPASIGVDRPPSALRRLAARCGPSAELLLASFGWPELAGAFFQTLLGAGGRAEELTRAAGPGAAAVGELSRDPDDVVAAAEIGLSPERPSADARKAADALLERVFGPPRADVPRADAAWGRGRILAFRRAQTGDRASYGFARGGASLGWFSHPQPRADVPPRPGIWLRARGGAARVLATERGLPVPLRDARASAGLEGAEIRAAIAGGGLEIEAEILGLEE